MKYMFQDKDNLWIKSFIVYSLYTTSQLNDYGRKTIVLT